MVTGSFSWSAMLAALVCYLNGERCTASSVSPLFLSLLTLQPQKLLDLRYFCRVIISVLHSVRDEVCTMRPILRISPSVAKVSTMKFRML